jgi:hypothetical protein
MRGGLRNRGEKTKQKYKKALIYGYMSHILKPISHPNIFSNYPSSDFIDLLFFIVLMIDNCSPYN